jgi:tetratricopeptide (TPR) repeat protein
LALAAAYASVTTLELPFWENEELLAQRGMSVSPGHPIALQSAGNVLIREQRASEAIPFLVDSVAAQPDNVDSLCSLTLCYSEVNALSLAEETVIKAMTIDPIEPRAHLLLGIVRYKQKRLDEAEEEIRRGLALQRVSTGIIMYHYYLGNVLDAKGDVQGAIREYRLEARNDGATDPAAVTASARLDQIEKREASQVQ